MAGCSLGRANRLICSYLICMQHNIKLPPCDEYRSLLLLLKLAGLTLSSSTAAVSLLFTRVRCSAGARVPQVADRGCRQRPLGRHVPPQRRRAMSRPATILCAAITSNSNSSVPVLSTCRPCTWRYLAALAGRWVVSRAARRGLDNRGARTTRSQPGPRATVRLRARKHILGKYNIPRSRLGRLVRSAQQLRNTCYRVLRPII